MNYMDTKTSETKWMLRLSVPFSMYRKLRKKARKNKTSITKLINIALVAFYGD